MNANRYMRGSLRTADRSNMDRLKLECALGLCGEAGEVAEQVKKHFFHGHEHFAQIRKTDRLIHRLDSTIATLRSSLTSTGSQLKQDKVQTSGPKNTLEETITKIIDLEAKINARIDELVSMKQEAFTMINRIPDLDQQNILIGRYIQLKKWEDISEELNYSMQWVFELHGKGLLAFAKANSDFLNNRENQSATGSKQSKESVE